MSNQTPATSKPRHKLLAQSRQWHKWGGIIAALFLLVVGASGIVLNYKKPIFATLGLEQDAREMKASAEDKPAKRDKAGTDFTTVNGFAAAAISAEQALALARESLGEVPLERIELKAERGEMLYKIKARGGDELWINAATGTHFVKGEYEKVKAGADGTVVTRATDWGKIILDLHTGKIGGEAGKAIMTAAAVLLLLLSVSGLYMWVKPLLARREGRRRSAVPAATAGKGRDPAAAAQPQPF